MAVHYRQGSAEKNQDCSSKEKRQNIRMVFIISKEGNDEDISRKKGTFDGHMRVDAVDDSSCFACCLLSE